MTQALVPGSAFSAATGLAGVTGGGPASGWGGGPGSGRGGGPASGIGGGPPSGFGGGPASGRTDGEGSRVLRERGRLNQARVASREACASARDERDRPDPKPPPS